MREFTFACSPIAGLIVGGFGWGYQHLGLVGLGIGLIGLGIVACRNPDLLSKFQLRLH